MSIRLTRQPGFSLIELMIVVAIVGILAAIAYPSYSDYVRETRRTTAQADLVELAQWMERQYAGDFSYLDGTSQPTLPFTQSPRTGTAFYNLSFNGSVAANTYSLQAVPTGDQTNDECGTLRITQTGARSSTSGTNCW